MPSSPDSGDASSIKKLERQFEKFQEVNEKKFTDLSAYLDRRLALLESTVTNYIDNETAELSCRVDALADAVIKIECALPPASQPALLDHEAEPLIVSKLADFTAGSVQDPTSPLVDSSELDNALAQMRSLVRAAFELVTEKLGKKIANLQEQVSNTHGHDGHLRRAPPSEPVAAGG